MIAIVYHNFEHMSIILSEVIDICRKLCYNIVTMIREGMILSKLTKCRRVCRFPETLEFFTTGETLGEPVILTVDEYETIRLIDKEGLS